eukprot:1351694-Amorphochlora_amoeboformis.AAC.2
MPWNRTICNLDDLGKWDTALHREALARNEVEHGPVYPSMFQYVSIVIGVEIPLCEKQHPLLVNVRLVDFGDYSREEHGWKVSYGLFFELSKA